MATKLAASTTDFALSVPDHCDLCGFPIVGIYIDGKTTSGPWANMCSMCFRDKGVGLGTGKGQRYEKQGADGKWAKMVPASEAKPRKKMPSMKTLERWSMDGVAKATDGCTVEPDGICSHGAKSWLLVAGVI